MLCSAQFKCVRPCAIAEWLPPGNKQATWVKQPGHPGGELVATMKNSANRVVNQPSNQQATWTKVGSHTPLEQSLHCVGPFKIMEFPRAPYVLICGDIHATSSATLFQSDYHVSCRPAQSYLCELNQHPNYRLGGVSIPAYIQPGPI